MSATRIDSQTIGSPNASPGEATDVAWHRSTLAVALLGSLALWAALPPWNLWILGWVAPVPWLLVVRSARLTGRRPYLALWLAGFVFWLLAVHWLRYPHPATHLGWLALAAYLAWYLPVFVGLSRVGVHRLGLPIMLVAPVVWTGLELARSHVITGFMMAGLGHTQYRWIDLIQIADLAGAYAVSFLVMLVAACLARSVPLEGSRLAWWPGLVAVAAVAGTLAYGHFRTSENAGRPGPRVALIQGMIAADWKQDAERSQRIFDQHYRLSEKAVAEAGRLDLIVWPETMYRRVLYRVSNDYRSLPERPAASFEAANEVTRRELMLMTRELKTPLLVGIDSALVRNEGISWFNSAVATDRDGALAGRYDKMHLVMFGEYIPFADSLPWIAGSTPIGDGMEAGREPAGFRINDVIYVPNVCFESVIPQVIHRQVRELRRQGQEPDVLVNLTNDAWFRGSSELEMHLVCGVFRAIECRKPFLAAANGGISASIDPCGRIVQESPRLETDVLVSQVTLDQRRSPYLALGDWPAGVCLLVCVALGLVGFAAAVAKKPNP